VLGNNKTISVHHVSVGDVCPIIKRTMEVFRIRKSLSGSGTAQGSSVPVNKRILDLGLAVEMVDETGTTPNLGKGVHGQVISDIIAGNKYCTYSRKVRW